MGCSSSKARAGDEDNTASPTGVIRREMFRAGKELWRTPYCGLRTAKEHKFGCLRLWAKWKSSRPIWYPTDEKKEEQGKKKDDEERAKEEKMKNGTEEEGEGEDLFQGIWQSVEWRPLVSYAGNHWRNLYSMVGKFALFAVRKLRIGVGVNAPRAILEEFHRYYKGLRLNHEDDLGRKMSGGGAESQGRPRNGVEELNPIDEEPDGGGEEGADGGGEIAGGKGRGRGRGKGMGKGKGRGRGKGTGKGQGKGKRTRPKKVREKE